MSIRQIIDWILDFQITWSGVKVLGYIFIGLVILGLLGNFAERVNLIFEDYAKEKNWGVIKKGLTYFIFYVASFFIIVVVLALVTS
jgi:hypothetical protein